jgi:hypothetical protein
VAELRVGHISDVSRHHGEGRNLVVFDEEQVATSRMTSPPPLDGLGRVRDDDGRET